MPIYEYKGQQYDIGTDDPAVAKQKILKHLGIGEEPAPEVSPPAREKTKWYEDIGAGLRDVPEQMTQAGLMGLGGVAGLVGAEDASDAMFEKYVERSKEFKEREEGVDRGEVGKVLRAVGQIPAYLTPTTAAMMIGSGAIKTGGDLVEEGASSGHALTGTMADAGSSAAMLALGPFANLSGRTANAALQGGLNVAQEAGINHPMQNAIRDSAGVQSLPSMTSGDYAAAFVPGAAMGAAFTKPRAPGQTTPDPVDPALQETRMPSVGDLDSGFVTQKKAVIDSIGKQIEKLQLQQAELARNGSMSEKQFKFYQSLQEQIDFKEGEIRKEAGILSKYEAGDKATQSHEDLKQAIAELDISQPKEVVRLPQQELVAPETRLLDAQELFDATKNADRLEPGLESNVDMVQEAAIIRDMADSLISLKSSGKLSDKQVAVLDGRVSKILEWFRKSTNGGHPFDDKYTNKQKGSWTPFAGEEPRPDDSDAPGVMQPQPRKGLPFKKQPLERQDPDFSDPRLKQPSPENGKTLAEWEVEDTAFYKEGLERTRPIQEYAPTPEGPRLSPEQQLNKLETSLGKVNTLIAKYEKAVREGSESGQTDINSLMKSRESFENRIEKFHETNPNLKLGGQIVKDRLTSKFASKDNTDPIDPVRTVSESMETLKGYGDLDTRKAILGTMFEKLLGTRTSWMSSESSNFTRAGYSLKDIFSSIARTRGVEQGEDGQIPLLYYDSEGYIGRFDIPKHLQGTGIGKAIWNTIKAEMKRDSFFLLSKPESVGFWKKMGFKVDKGWVEEKGENVPMSLGRANPFAKKQGGMWTPFADSRDTNAKRATEIAKSLDIEQNIDVTKRFSSKEVLERMQKEGVADSSGSTIHAIEREFAGRGQYVEANKRAQPIVWEVAKILKAAKDNEIKNKRGWWSGTASKLVAKAMGPFMKLSHYKDPETPEHIKIASTDKDRVSISEYMQLAQKEHVSHILRDSPSLTEGQRKVLDAFNTLTPFQQKGVKVFTNMLEQIRKTRAIPYLAGFIPHVRKGDFAVYIKTSLGDPAHLETFPSKGTADAWIKMAKEKGYDVSDVVDFKTPEGQSLAESFGLVRDILDSMNSNDPQRQAWINKIMDTTLEKVSSNPDIGRHREHYTGLGGFLGNRLFKSRLENANDFFKSMEEYSSSSAAQNKKVEIIRAKNLFWDNPEGRKLRENYPNQAETADFLVDVAMNKDQKYGWTESVDHFRTKVDDMYVKMLQKVAKVRGKDPDLLYYPDVPILDRATGAGAQLFYISALTTRPGFWVGQALTSPFAVRQFLKEGTIADTLVSQGKGWGTVMTGGDAEWKAFVKDMANQSDSVHPQFMNEINSLPGMNKMSSMHLDSLVQVLTGQRPAGMADAFSRYTVAAMAYHHYKNLGMKGDQLASNVRRMVDDTMVMYDREHSPSIFNKMGLVGQNIAPLQKYGIAQLENLIGDLKFIGQRPEGMSAIRAMAPAISTLMTTMIMAGSVGLPLLLEYELLRAGFVGVSKFLGWDDVEDYVPKSVLELMLTDDTIRDTLIEAGMSEESAQTMENATTHGALSAVTGYDLGSSLRFNAYAPGADQHGQMSALSAFPVVKFLADMGDLVFTQVRKHTAGDVTIAEDRATQLKPQFFVGQRAAIDAMKFDANTRDFVPGGQRGYAQVEQTPQEQIGQVIGSKPLETAKKTAATQIEQRRDKKMAAMKQKAVDLLVDGLTHDDEKKIEKAYSMAIRAEMTPKQLQEQVRSVMHERTTPRWEDRFTNRKGQVKSTQQKQRYERMERYE